MKVSERQRSLLVFNRSRGHLYIHIFRDNVQGTFNLDVYTLPGRFSSPCSIDRIFQPRSDLRCFSM